ncbi:hypothetical protein AAMO2058_000197800 [Amorphochlora amoebiformis]
MELAKEFASETCPDIGGKQLRYEHNDRYYHHIKISRYQDIKISISGYQNGYTGTDKPAVKATEYWKMMDPH